MVMIAAGIDTKLFKPHSTRAAATSRVKAACVPIHEILNTAAGWSSSRCFDRFYDKPIEALNSKLGNTKLEIIDSKLKVQVDLLIFERQSTYI